MNIKNNETINIAFVVDKNYFDFVMVMVCSILDHSQSRYRAYILYTGIDKAMMDICHNKFSDDPIEFIFIEFNKEKYNQYSMNNKIYTLTTYAKFEIPELVAEDKIIYLDSDMIVVKDLLPLWQLFDPKYSIMAASNPSYSKWKDRDILGLEDQQKTFNAGVLLMNLKKIRETGTVQQLFDFTNRNHDQIKLLDEAAFNYVFQKDWAEIPSYYNYTTLFFRRKYSIAGISKEEYSDAKRNLTIIHFTGRDKPWSFISPHPMNRVWQSYYSRCIKPFRYQNVTLKNIVKKVTRKIKFILSYNKKV